MNKVYTRKNVLLEKKVEGKSQYAIMLKSILKGLLITFATFGMVAYLLTYTEFKESYVNPIVMGVSILSCFVIGFDFSKHNKEKGLLYGCLGGLIYFIIYVAIGMSIAHNTLFDTRLILVGSFSVFSGCLGGVLGVNGR